ncbi:MAG: glucuronate isomerase [Balneolaceae bacterium]|nr:glucuronate isomerase [Balneolaceae bacterium]
MIPSLNIWLDGDHNQWRSMRTLGISEKYINGDANDKTKFEKWLASRGINIIGTPSVTLSKMM